MQDPMGQTGLAHMFEHMAFKGTDTIGTTNYAAEKVALAKVEGDLRGLHRGARPARGPQRRPNSKSCKRCGRMPSQKRRNTWSPTSFRRFWKATEAEG